MKDLKTYFFIAGVAHEGKRQGLGKSRGCRSSNKRAAGRD